jgi:N-acetylglucosamine kinase-like BadF-type ATPase
MECYLWIDSGGSKCEALLVGTDGRALGWGLHRKPGVSGRGRDGVGAALRQALARVGGQPLDIHVVSICGLSAGDPRPAVSAGRTVQTPAEGTLADLVERAGGGRPVTFGGTSEMESGLALHGQAWGVVALAGTGAFVHVRCPDGRHLHLDGLGPVLGDHGSAYQIGLRAFREAARSEWHPRRATALRPLVFDALGVGTVGGAVRFSLTAHDRSVYASLAARVDAAARGGDATARRILEDAADDLAETVRDAVSVAGVEGRPCALVGIGSVATRSAIYWERLCCTVGSFAPQLRPMADRRPPVIGVVAHRMGLRQGLDPAGTGRLAAAIAASLREYGRLFAPAMLADGGDWETPGC